MVKKFEWYKADDEKTHFKRRTPKPAKLKHGVQPGQVLVILAGRFRGKRVVFLKQLDSGLLLVTGPHKVNGVPLKRVNQAYTIATSTNVAVDAKAFEKINDGLFAKSKADKASSEKKFFSADQAPAKKVVSEERKSAQKSVDTAISAALKKDAMLRKYLASRFTLTHSSRPHALKF